MSDQEIEISALEVYAMVIARDALIEQLLTLAVGPGLAAIYESSTGEIDRQIRNGLLSGVQEVASIGDLDGTG